MSGSTRFRQQEKTVPDTCQEPNPESVPDIFEDCVEDVPMRNELTLERVQADRDGLIRVPDRPGLGVTLNEEFVKRYLIAESR